MKEQQCNSLKGGPVWQDWSSLFNNDKVEKPYNCQHDSIAAFMQVLELEKGSYYLSFVTSLEC